MSGFDLVSVRLDESETVKKAFCHFVRSLKASRRRPSVSRPTGRLTHEVVPAEEEENVGLDFGGVVYGDVSSDLRTSQQRRLVLGLVGEEPDGVAEQVFGRTLPGPVLQLRPQV